MFGENRESQGRVWREPFHTEFHPDSKGEELLRRVNKRSSPSRVASMKHGYVQCPKLVRVRDTELVSYFLKQQ